MDNNIEFNEEQKNNVFLYSKIKKSKDIPRVVGFLIDNKIAKNEKTAILILLAVVGFFIALSIVLFFSNGSSIPTEDSVVKSLQGLN